MSEADRAAIGRLSKQWQAAKKLTARQQLQSLHDQPNEIRFKYTEVVTRINYSTGKSEIIGRGVHCPVDPIPTDLIAGLLSGPLYGITKAAMSSGSKIVVSQGAGKAVKSSPINPEPLPESVAKTFRSATYTQTVTQEETILYRTYGGKAGELGGYWTRTKPSGPVQAVIDSALDQNWGNTATQVSAIRVPKGTTIFEGAAAPQRGLVGGENQIYIQEVNPSWLIK